MDLDESLCEQCGKPEFYLHGPKKMQYRIDKPHGKRDGRKNHDTIGFICSKCASNAPLGPAIKRRRIEVEGKDSGPITIRRRRNICGE